jgi:hypothetical protein
MDNIIAIILYTIFIYTYFIYSSPAIINLAPPPSTTASLSSSGGGSPPLTSPLTTLTPVTSHSPPLPYPPKPLVEPLDSDRPERMRDWLVRMINSGQFPGLKWLDQEKMVFRVPWIHAKKRDYNQERDAALFREWAIHSGKNATTKYSSIPTKLILITIKKA